MFTETCGHLTCGFGGKMATTQSLGFLVLMFHIFQLHFRKQKRDIKIQSNWHESQKASVLMNLGLYSVLALVKRGRNSRSKQRPNRFTLSFHLEVG